MRRLFVSLYLSIAITLAVFIFVLPPLLGNVFERQLIESVSQISSVPRDLLEAELSTVPPSLWPAHVEQLSQKFGYQLTLRRLAELDVSDVMRERLARGEASASIDDEPDIMYLPIRGSDYVVLSMLSETEQEKIERTTAGYYYLVEKQLASLTPAQSKRYLESLSAQSILPFVERPLAELTLSASERARLMQGGIVGRDFEGNEERYFKLSPDKERVMVIGPIPTPWLVGHIDGIALLVLAALFFAVVFFWLRPMWRDMLALDTGAASLGQGDLAARVSVSRRSPIRRLVDTFNAMASRIDKLVGAHKTLVDSVSHELRTPISRLRFGVEGIGSAATDGQRHTYVASMTKDIDELDQLVDELLTFSRLDHAQPDVQVQAVGAQEWLARIASEHALTGGEVELAHAVEEGVEAVVIDAHLMTRAVRNLVSNALRYANAYVVVAIERAGDRLRISVDDDGPGIAADDREAVFEAFNRLEASRNRESGGYGLGLAIVRRVCEWHGAQITLVDSALGGARFEILLAAE